jgi:hypothetical protein
VTPIDYIVRLIEQFSRILARIISKKQAKAYTEALFEAENTYKRLIGLEAQLIHSLSDADLIEWLNTGDTLDIEKCVITAELLREEAEIKELSGCMREDFTPLYIKSFSLYHEVLNHREIPGPTIHIERVQFVVNKLESMDLPLKTRYKLFRTNEMLGNLGKAEDLLYDLIQADYPGIRIEGKDFYERLLRKSDQELETGNLPRKEVEEGLAWIEKIRFNLQSEYRFKTRRKNHAIKTIVHPDNHVSDNPVRSDPRRTNPA